MHYTQSVCLSVCPVSVPFTEHMATHYYADMLFNWQWLIHSNRLAVLRLYTL